MDVKDYGDVEIPSCYEPVDVDNMKNLPLISACNKNLSDMVSQVLKDDRVAVTIGGDHSIGVGKLVQFNFIFYLVILLSQLVKHIV